MDHLLPLYVREAGGLVVYVPGAVATDRPISGLREQFRNRTRTATRGIRANLSMVGKLAPWRHPGPALAIWSHKLLRWATPWFIALAAITGLWLGTLGGAPAYLAAPIAVVVGALAGRARAPDHRRRPAAAADRRLRPLVRRREHRRSRWAGSTSFAVAEIEVWHRAEFRIEG